jgi:GTP cyclohydrolase I
MTALKAHQIAWQNVRKEIFGGLNPARKPNASTFDNNYKYGEMLVEKNIITTLPYEHHLLPIIGRAHVGYISNGRVIDFQNEPYSRILC